MATIRKRKGKWQVQIRRQNTKGLSRTFHKKSDAEVWARQIETDIESGRYYKPSIPDIHLSDLLMRYRDEVSSKKKGVTSEEYRINNMLTRPIARMKLLSLSSSEFATYRDTRLKEVSSSSVRRELTILRHCIEVAKTDWNIPIETNPVNAINAPKETQPRERRLSKDELEKLKYGSQSMKTPYLWPMISLALETAMRRGELLSVKTKDINFNFRTLHIPRTKTGYPRKIPLSQKALESLSSITSEGDKLFRVSPNAFRLAWERLKLREGIINLRFHDLRHEAISRLFEMGLSMPEVALISGHRDPRMLMRYTHLRAEDIALKLNY